MSVRAWLVSLCNRLHCGLYVALIVLSSLLARRFERQARHFTCNAGEPPTAKAGGSRRISGRMAGPAMLHVTAADYRIRSDAFAV